MLLLHSQAAFFYIKERIREVMFETILKTGIYVRLSQEDRNKLNKNDESESIQNQKQMLTDYCNEKGWGIYDIYCDEDYSGADRDRPDYNRLLSDARNHKFDIVLCKTQSRFTREMEHVEKYINFLFPLWGVRFISVVDGVDSGENKNKKARQINGLINEWYLEDLSENIKSTLLMKRRAGMWVGAFAPYGYKKDPKDKHHLVIDEEAAEVVRYIYQLYISGYGKTAIARILNEKGIPNPATYKQQHNQPFQCSNKPCANIWRHFTVDNIICNEIYIGNTVQGKSANISYKSTKKRQIPKSEWCVVEGTHDAIIDADTWKKSVRIKQERTTTTTKNCTPTIFANKIRCAKCGGAMRIYISNQKRYYRCGIKYESPQSCEGTYVSVGVIEREVLKQIQMLYDHFFDAEAISEKVVVDSSLEQQLVKIKAKRSQVEMDIQKNVHRIKTLYIDKVDGVISASEYQELSSAFSRDKQNLEKELVLLNDKGNELSDLISSRRSKIEMIKTYKGITSLDRNIVDTLIDYIEVGGSRYDRVINIYWNF